MVRILVEVSLQLHRSRYWKTATIDAQLTTRAAKIFWAVDVIIPVKPARCHRCQHSLHGEDPNPNGTKSQRFLP
jgi:hypothetical protein